MVSYRAIAGAQSIHDAVQRIQKRFGPGGPNAPPGPILGIPLEDQDALDLYSVSESLPEVQSRSLEPSKTEGEPVIGMVGILGAGAAGLYSAMILESLGIKCEILEAAPKPGGRLHTHYFDEGQDPTKYQYYDVGAMRYPEIPIMERTFDLFKRVRFTKENGKLIKYYMNAEDNNTPLLYNNIRWNGTNPPEIPNGSDYFKVGTDNGGTVPQSYVEEGVDTLLDDAFDPYKKALADDWHTGWQALMANDPLSTRTFMSQKEMIKPPGEGETFKAEMVPGLDYPFDVVQWCENMNSATGLYEEAFSESVMDSLDFGWPSAARPGGVPSAAEAGSSWICIDGGGSTLIKSMVDKLHKTTIHYNTRVNAITGIRHPNLPAATTSVVVKTVPSTPEEVRTGAVPRPQTGRIYSHVLSSLPLSVLGQGVDISKAGFDYQQANAIRALHYDCSVKVGIRFSKQWWRLPPFNITGGTSSTDRPLRTCVYPSYGLQTDPQTPGVLIVSYTWAQDATRIGAVVKGSDFKTRVYPEERELIDLLFRDLANLHGANESDLRRFYMDHYAHNWFEDPNANGAFALYGAGQFSNMYPSITRPAAYNRRLHLMGEATSVHHAWVVGALNSAWRGIFYMLLAAGCKPDDSRILKLLKNPCRPDGSYDEQYWGPVPEEVDLVFGRPTPDQPRGGFRGGLGDLPRGIPEEGFAPPATGGKAWWDAFTPGREEAELEEAA